jgi:cytochrome c5
MSDPHSDGQSPIKTPQQLIVVVALAFIVPVVVIILLVTFVDSGMKRGAGSEAMTSAAVTERIAPVAHESAIDPNAPKTLKGGEDVFKAVCTTCHTAGVAGAPKFGDASAWAPRIKQGEATLWDHALKGFKGMPAKGGDTDLEDVEVERAVVYMTNASGGKLADPPLPSATAAAAPQAPAPALGSTPDPSVVAAVAAANSGATPKPVALASGAAGDDTAAGQKLFQAICTACHTAGIAGAPKFGDKAAWAPRIAKGLNTLYDHAIHGFQDPGGVMPPKGGSSASDDDVKSAVRYMVNAAK